jgi:general L-amino acid transport system permease protein
MSDTQNPGISFVRTTMVPQAEPPTRESGAVKWVRENLLSSWLNGILTVIALYVVWYVVSHLYPWLAGSVWTAGSLTECRETLISYGREVGSSACGAVIADRWLQLLFGFYPADLYWRPIVAFALFFVAIAPVLFSETMPRQLIWFSIGYPFLAVWLIWGGAFWVPILVFLGFAAGGLGLFAGNKLAGPILGAIGAILFATIWWGFVTPFANEYLNETVAKSRLESRVAEINATMTILGEEISAADAQATELEGAI